MELWSQAFLDEGEAEWATCTMGVAAWKRLTEHHSEATRLVAKIEYAGKTWHCSLGSPSTSVSDEHYNHLYLPPWMVEQMGAEGCGDRIKVKWMSAESLPEAAHIVLKPQDSAFYYADAREELERALTRLGVLQKGSVVSIPLESLGGYPVQFGVVRTEPAEVVLAQGDEVAIEFEEAHDYAAQTRETVRAAPTPPPAAQTEDFESMIPSFQVVAATAAQKGQRLGGSAPRRTADGKPWNPWREMGK